MVIEDMKPRKLPTVPIKTMGYKCLRCGHVWVPRKKNNIPELCPVCKNARWHTPATGRK